MSPLPIHGAGGVTGASGVLLRLGLRSTQEACFQAWSFAGGGS